MTDMLFKDKKPAEVFQKEVAEALCRLDNILHTYQPAVAYDYVEFTVCDLINKLCKKTEGHWINVSFDAQQQATSNMLRTAFAVAELRNQLEQEK